MLSSGGMLLRRPPLVRQVGFTAGPALARLYSTGHEVLHESRIPTLHFQDSLPKLPVPSVDDTLQSLLYSAKAITTMDEYEEASRLCADFAAGIGPSLQEALIARDKAKYSRCMPLLLMRSHHNALTVRHHCRSDARQLHHRAMV